MSVGGRTGFTDGRDQEVVSLPPKGVVRDYIETILVCVIFVIFSRAFAFQQSKIPSGSMEDTLKIGDYIMVNRFIYAPTVFDWEKELLPIRDIHRGDIVVFKFPLEPETDYIKRVIGLPGDTVEIKRGHVFVNGEQFPDPFVNEAYRLREDREPLHVEPDHYFVMGDHRDRSADLGSRSAGPDQGTRSPDLVVLRGEGGRRGQEGGRPAQVDAEQGDALPDPVSLEPLLLPDPLEPSAAPDRWKRYIRRRPSSGVERGAKRGRKDGERSPGMETARLGRRPFRRSPSDLGVRRGSRDGRGALSIAPARVPGPGGPSPAARRGARPSLS
jgi:signal peptidase I